MKQKLILSLFVFFLIGITKKTFTVSCVTNSSGQETCAAIIFNPTTLADIQSAVAQAITDGKQIRAFGGLHSAIGDVEVGDDNYLINMEQVNKILEINPSKMTIKVQGGINLYVLSHELAKIGLALIDQPGPYDATSGGMSSNASHESGLHGCVSDSILEIQIVDGLGNLRTVSETENPEWLPAARVSLGVLGIIYSVTFQCVPTTNRHVVQTLTTTQQIIPKINCLLHRNDNFQFLIDPLGQSALKQTFNITCKPVTLSSKVFNYAKYLTQGEAVGALNEVTIPLVPPAVYPIIDEAIVAGQVTDNINFFYKGYSYFHDNVLSRARIAELSIEARFVVPALQDLFDLIQKFKNDGFSFILTGEVRYVADQNFMYLSPTNRPSWLIGLILIFPFDTPAATELLFEYTKLMQDKYNGRPQWGNNPEFLTYPETLRLYGQENVNAFNAIRRIFDPNGLYYTPYFVQRLGPL